jgi:ribonuclease HI
MDQYKVFTDGGARGNPGPAAIGVVIIGPDGKTVVTHGEYIGNATNNQAEYRALVWAIDELARRKIGSVEFCLDSELVVKQMQGSYKVRDEKLKDLAMQALRGLNRIPQFRFVHIAREKNADADSLVNEALDEQEKKHS